MLQALTKQDEHIEELESAAQEMQEQLAAANKSVEQYASSMQKVRSLLHVLYTGASIYPPTPAIIMLH